MLNALDHDHLIDDTENELQIRIPNFLAILVGSGSSGSAVVHRLAMDSHNYKVLLLEVGGNQFPLSGVPALLFQLLNNPEIDWSDTIVPQKGSCKAFNNNVRTEM